MKTMDKHPGRLLSRPDSRAWLRALLSLALMAISQPVLAVGWSDFPGHDAYNMIWKCDSIVMADGRTPEQYIADVTSNITIPAGAAAGTIVKEINAEIHYKGCDVPNRAAGGRNNQKIYFFRSTYYLDGSGGPKGYHDGFLSGYGQVVDYQGLKTGLSISSSLNGAFATGSRATSCVDPFGEAYTIDPNRSDGDAVQVHGQGTPGVNKAGICNLAMKWRFRLVRNTDPIQTNVFPGSGYDWFRGYAYMNQNGDWETYYRVSLNYPNGNTTVEYENPRVRIAQTTTGGVGTFQFNLSGLDAKQLSLTTVTAGVTVTSNYFNGAISTALEVVQTPPTAWSPTPVSVSCIDANGASNGNGSNNIGSLAGSKVVVLASAMKAGSDITCVFVNTRNNIRGKVFNDGGAPSAGVNTGTPNDGLLNGAEAGLAGVVVSLTNCANNVFSNTVTDNTGTYSLNLAAAQAAQTVCVAASLPSSYLATGASADTTPLPSGNATTVSGTAYTYTRSSNQVSFTASSSGAILLNFGLVPESKLIIDNNLTAAPGAVATHSHRFTAGTGGTLTLSTQNGLAIPSTLTGWNEAIYQDATCSGTYVSNAANWSPPNNTMSVTQGQSVCFVVQEFVPANAQNGNSFSMQVKAQLSFSNATPSLSASYTVTDITTVSSNVVLLKKQVRNITTGGVNAPWKTENEAQSGDVLEYQITFTNISIAPVSELVIQDGSPAWTTWTQATSGTLPANMTCTMNTPANPVPQAARACSPAVTGSGTGNLTWKFNGSLQPQASGNVLFRVTVN